MTSEELTELLRQAPEPTSDDVPITSDGQRLDSKETVLAFCADLAAERGVALELDAAAVLLVMTRTHLGRVCGEGRIECFSFEGAQLVPATEVQRILLERSRVEGAPRAPTAPTL
jgi:hypothetical protein